MDDIQDWQRQLAAAREKRKNALITASRNHMIRMTAELQRWQQENADIEETYLEETEGLEN